MTHALYVYFRVGAEADSQRRRLAAMQAELAAQTGVSGRLLCHRDDPSTWMEVYEGIVDAGGFATALAAALVRHGVSGWGIERHEEWFRPL